MIKYIPKAHKAFKSYDLMAKQKCVWMENIVIGIIISIMVNLIQFLKPKKNTIK